MAVPAPVGHPGAVTDPGERHVLRPVGAERRNRDGRGVGEGKAGVYLPGTVAAPPQQPINPNGGFFVGYRAGRKRTGTLDRFAGAGKGAVRVSPVSAVGVVAADAGEGRGGI